MIPKYGSYYPSPEYFFKDNFGLSLVDRELIVGIGEVATINIPSISNKTVRFPVNIGDVLHINIGYGCKAGIGGGSNTHSL